MRYKSLIQKNLSFFHKQNKIVFGFLSFFLHAEKIKVIKQKIKLMLKETPPPSVSSDTERLVFEKLKNRMNVVFDVGIQNELSFYKIKPDCNYHLFEPSQKFLKLIKKQIADFKNHHIRVNEYGLSDKRQDDCVYYEESESFVINPAFKNNDVDTGIRYSLRTIDDYVTENNIQKIDFLKIDTEGFDYKILVGATKSIKADKISFVQFEFWKGVNKFVDLLSPDFDLYLMMEPKLLEFINKQITPVMTPAQKKINYSKSLIPLTPELIDLIDTKIVPQDACGNVFCINRHIKDLTVNELIFDINTH